MGQIFFLYKFCTCEQISLCRKPIKVSVENREHQRLATLRHTYVSSFDIVLMHAMHEIQKYFQQDISSRPFILCRPHVCLLSGSSKIKTNKQKKQAAVAKITTVLKIGQVTMITYLYQVSDLITRGVRRVDIASGWLIANLAAVDHQIDERQIKSGLNL